MNAMPTVLLVDDEVLLREGVQEVLELHGFNVMGVGDGQQALDWLSHTPASLVVSDLVMPGMNGVDFIQQLRRLYPDLPVIVASGSPYVVLARMGIDSIQVRGATVSIKKPFKGAELVSLIRQVLSVAAV